jgi:hypothetical protein
MMPVTRRSLIDVSADQVLVTTITMTDEENDPAIFSAP